MEYVTYDSMFLFASFVVALIGLVIKICSKDKK